MNELQIQNTELLQLQGCKLTAIGAVFKTDLEFEQWESIGETVQFLDKSVRFWVGDWINFGERKFGDKYSQALKITNYKEQSLMDSAWVCRQVQISLRSEKLSFSHHREVAPLQPDLQKFWLNKAEQDGLTTRELKEAIKSKSLNDSRGELQKLALNVPENDRIKVWHGDFWDKSKEIESDSVDLILTDPPYPQEFLPLWQQLGFVAERILKPGSFLVAYSGQLYLPTVMENLGENLEYYWLAGLHHEGQQAQRFERHVQNAMKPILIYYKPPIRTQEKWLQDLVKSPAASKEFHEWGQSLDPVKTLLETFSNPNDLVVDPFGGGGTTAVACKTLLRQCISIDIEKENCELTIGRLAAVQPEK